MYWTRRKFLKTLGLSTAAFSLNTQWVPNAFAANDRQRKFIFCYFSGGWDTLLCLDPRDPGEFNASNFADTGIQPGYEMLDSGYSSNVIVPDPVNYPHMTFGPAIENFATAHYQKSCIIRGVVMNTLTHGVGRRFFVTGKEPRGLSANGSSIGTQIASAQGELSPIPNLVSGVEAFNEAEPKWASPLSVNGITDLIAVLDDGPDAPNGNIREALDRYRATATDCDPALYDRAGFLTYIRETQTKARELVAQELSGRFKFTNGGDPEMVAIRARYGIPGNLSGPGAQAALAYQAIKYDIAQSVTVQLASGLDTHDEDWATDQPDNLSIGFNALSQLVTDLETTPDPEGGTLLDNTTILCFSEFGREAKINNRGGRDHNLNSSALMLGAGVPKGVVVGATSNKGMGSYSIDPNTGNVMDDGQSITPTDIHASIMQSAGYDTTYLRKEGMPCLMDIGEE